MTQESIDGKGKGVVAWCFKFESFFQKKNEAVKEREREAKQITFDKFMSFKSHFQRF